MATAEKHKCEREKVAKPVSSAARVTCRNGKTWVSEKDSNKIGFQRGSSSSAVTTRPVSARETATNRFPSAARVTAQYDKVVCARETTTKPVFAIPVPEPVLADSS